MDRRSQVSDIYVKNRSICQGPADSLHKGITLGTRQKPLTGSAIFINGGLYKMKQLGKILNFIQNDRWGGSVKKPRGSSSISRRNNSDRLSLLSLFRRHRVENFRSLSWESRHGTCGRIHPVLLRHWIDGAARLERGARREYVIQGSVWSDAAICGNKPLCHR